MLSQTSQREAMMTMQQEISYFEVELDGKFGPKAARQLYYQATMIRLTALVCHLQENVMGSLLHQIEPENLDKIRTNSYQLTKKNITLHFEITNECENKILLYDSAIVVNICAYKEGQRCLISEAGTIEYLIDVIKIGAGILSQKFGADFSAMVDASRKFAEDGWVYRKRLKGHDRKVGAERWLEVDMHSYRIQVEAPDANGNQVVLEYYDLGSAKYDYILEIVKGLRKVKQGSGPLRSFLSVYPHYTVHSSQSIDTYAS